MSWNPIGSEWHRWDPHMHAPGTLLSDQFDGNWEAYLTAIENSSPSVRALGVTDYFCIQTYQQVRKHKVAGRIPQVELLFPNVELRLDIKTGKNRPVNLHLLFSPEDPNHEQEIERLLGQLQFEFRDRTYSCSRGQLIELGRAFDTTQTDELGALRTGVNQFKTSLADLRALFRKEQWLRQYCLVAVAGGSNDGTAGLQEDDSFAATRREIERFANIIFASTPKQRQFWLGQLPQADAQKIEEVYGSLKPCLHGSDSHRQETVALPPLDRFCWLRGDLAFETLRQAVIEPDQRVCIAESPPPGPTPSEIVQRITCHDAPWLATPSLQLNSGLVTIIGARGSGKTALMDLLAAAAGAYSLAPSDSSFLQRASRPIDLVGQASLELDWGSGEQTARSLRQALDGRDIDQAAQVCYLSQQFVEQLCSSAGLAIELRREMERVVFEATDPWDRMEANSFDGLAETLLNPAYSRRKELQASIQTIGVSIVREESSRDQLPAQVKSIEALTKQIAVLRKDLANLLPKAKEQHIKRLAELEGAYSLATARLETLRKRRKLLDELIADVKQTKSFREPTRFGELTRRFSEAGLSTEDWQGFRMVFAGDVDSVVTGAIRALDQEIQFAIAGDPAKAIDVKTAPLGQWSLQQLQNARDVTKQEVGIDVIRQKKYEDLTRTITEQEAALRRLEAEHEVAKGAPERRRALIDRRREEYIEVFKTVTEEEDILKGLYLPLSKTLTGAKGALSKLAFVIHRHVNLKSWVAKGEQLLDLRRESRLRGHGALRKESESLLLTAWTSGSPEAVDAAMDLFRETFTEDILKSQPEFIEPDQRRQWLQSVASWLYDTSHITVQYGILYEGTPIEQLSPGTRGIVLLLLYLAVDTHDPRPLLIDQPEENLDPQSVFEELVPHFRAARARRQVIVVTHNANLVVNTDADQVIVASSQRTEQGGLPTITYQSGSLENPEIRGAVCRLLEGGQRAFLERARRYRLHVDESSFQPTP
jgi:energy-coupling factor transporter ATP-binding protein EcfA2